MRLRGAFLLSGDLSRFCPASRLHISITNKAALATAAACFGTAHRLQVAVTDKAALAASST
jgi:hypothetical protein